VERLEASIFRVPLDGAGTLAITPRPRGGDWLGDDIEALAAGGVDILVSLLTAEEEIELGLQAEPAVCAAHGVEFVSSPLPDRGAPADTRGFVEHVRRLVMALRAGKSVAVHCRQSVGRAGLLATSVAVALGLTVESAIERVSAARGVQVPETVAQHDWLRQNAARLSG
jgi:protein-tyrosine phosphatase